MIPGTIALSPGNEPSPAEEVHIVDLAFDVVKVEMPMNGGRPSRKIWNHVDEMRLDPRSAVRLARNGLRIGAASPSAWPAIRAILDAAQAELSRDRLMAQPGLPLMIKLGAVEQPESLFCYASDGRLVGRTVPAGDKLLSIEYAFHPELGGCTELQLGFEIRRDLGVLTWERRGGVIRQVPSYDRQVFEEVGATLTLNADEFLVIGLNHEVENEYLVGSRFLSTQRSGRRYETLFLVTPRPFQTRGAKRRPL